MSAEAKLASMGLALPEMPKPLANYVPFKISGNTLYLSGQGPRRNDGTLFTGKVGKDVTPRAGLRARQARRPWPAGGGQGGRGRAWTRSRC